MSGLEIPERAYAEGDLGSDERDVIRRAAPIIVAAELRRLSNESHHIARTARNWLQERADELDPPVVGA